jgi:hypothetical protein
MVDMVVHRHDMRDMLSRLVHLMMRKSRPTTRLPPPVISANATRPTALKPVGPTASP